MKNISDDHPYFDEIFELASMTVANMSLLMHAAATSTIRKLVDFLNEMVRRKSTDIDAKVNDHAMLATIPMEASGSNEIVTLLEADHLFAFLAGTQKHRPTHVAFRVDPAEKRKHCPGAARTSDRTTWEGADPSRRFEMLSAYVVGGAYERTKARIVYVHGSDPYKWKSEAQFFRHLRNACFHSNTFEIRPYQGQPQIDPLRPPRWHTYEMASDTAMNGKKAMGGFFHVHQTIPFLYEMGDLV